MSIQSTLKGWTGEVKTQFAQALFLDSKIYNKFNNVILQLPTRTTQIDHVVVSKYGVFVVETKNKDGWIFGGADQDQWIQTFFKNKFRFQNPLRQNYLHESSLANFLKLDRNKIHSVIVFWGDCEFKTDMPENVLLRNEYTRYIKSKKEEILSDYEVNEICLKLKNIKDNTGIFSSLNHARTLKKLYNSTTECPRCGAKLVERKPVSTGTHKNVFLGCSSYPACRYIKKL